MQTTFTGLQTRGYRIAHNRIVTATLRWPCVCVHVDTIMRHVCVDSGESATFAHRQYRIGCNRTRDPPQAAGAGTAGRRTCPTGRISASLGSGKSIRSAVLCSSVLSNKSANLLLLLQPNAN